MAFDDTYRESIQTKHIANVGFTSTAKGVTNEANALKNPHQLIASQIPAVDVVGTYGPLVATGIGAGLVEKHTVKLTADPTVNNNRAWFATENNCTETGHSARGTIRIDQWMRYAETQYKLRLFEDTGSNAPDYTAEILPSEATFNWEYDASTGIVYFDEDPSANGKTLPLWAEIYTYVGSSVEDGLGASSSGVADLVELFDDTNEPSGFIDRTSSSISFDDGSRNFTISGTSYSYYIEGEKYTKTGAETVQITATEGMHYVYYDGATLSHTATFTYDLIFNKAYVAAIYWDDTNATAIHIGDERHGITMDGQTHAYLHSAFGTQYIDGLGVTNITADGDGSSNAHVTVGYTEGHIRDEDVLHSLPAEASPATIPVFYKSGVSGEWRMVAANNYPLIDNHSGATLPKWNQWTGATWQLTEAVNDDLILSHLFATNDINNPVIAIAGQAVYNSVAAARDGANNEINDLILTGMPFVEFIPIGTLIYMVNSAYTNAPKARIITDAEGNDYVDWRFSGYSPNPQSVADHANLTGREANNSHPAAAISVDVTNFDGALGSLDAQVQTALETLDDAVYANTTLISTTSGILQSQISQNASDIGDNYTAIGNNATAISNNYTTLDNKIDTVSGTLHDEIIALGEAQNEFLELEDVEVASYTDGNMLYTTASGVADTANLKWAESIGTLYVTTPVDSSTASFGPSGLDIENADNSNYFLYNPVDGLEIGFNEDPVFIVDSNGISLETGGSVNEISTTISVSSTDAQLPTAKSVWDYVEAKPTTFLDLTDTFSSFTDGRIPFETSTSLIDDAALTYVSGTQTFNAPNITTTADVNVGGDLDITGFLEFNGDVDGADRFSHTLDETTGRTTIVLADGLWYLNQTTSGTLQAAIDNLDTSLTDAIVWEVVDTPFEQIRPKVAHQGKAIYTAGNLTIGGDLTVSGTTTTVHSEELTVADKVITVNAGEAGAGITGSQYAGIEVDRGSETDYLFVFDEVQDNFRVGISGSLQAVATREDTPIDTRVPYWNESDVRFDTSGDQYITIASGIDMYVNTANVLSLTETSQTVGNSAGSYINVTETSFDVSENSIEVLSLEETSQLLGVSDDTNIALDQSADTITFAVANTTEATITTDGLSLKTGASVNEIQDSLTGYISSASTDDQLATSLLIYTEMNTLSGSLQSDIDDAIANLANNYYNKTELDGGQLDNRYYTETEIDTIVSTTSGTLQSAIDDVATDLSTNYYTSNSVDGLFTTHTASESTDHDNRYYTETEIDILFSTLSGTVSGDYYTKTDLDGGQLDNRYYTESEIDTSFSYYYTASQVDSLLGGQNAFLELVDVEVASFTAGNILFTTASGVTDDSGFTFDSGTLSTTAITLGTGGSVNEIVTTVTSGTTDSQVPTAKAVWDLTEAAAAAVHTHYDVDAVHDTDTSWTYDGSFDAVPDGLIIFVNGVKQRIGAEFDCTADVGDGILVITFNYSVRTSDWVSVNYYA